ncbi:flagellar basal-body MS-ring/collar protein FliF [uncultured Clostridium sp.]|uniref:flagellar basal-body MS-ring/collar protein FliF n=1 Tax=uncultured Clostridium sp. TaxID=59620 RepID=UPI0028EEDFA1|nr:flagellar basal-body MS-ring/collar protein FliF [uncultured Clostridium sp.]
MNKLSQGVNKLKETLGNLSKKKKIAYGAIFIGIICTLIYLGITLTSTKYSVLFSNIDNNDMGSVYNKLKEKKENFKVEGNTILVPSEKVDSLRMEILSEVPMNSGSQGFELLDKSKFGATDAEMKINYQRALQGELERTIKSFPEIDNVRVHLVLPEDSAFIKDETPAQASLTLKLKPYKKLSKDQVKAIVALVSGSVKNLPRENIEVNDTNGSLTKDLYEDEEPDMAGAAEKQQALEREYEKNLENKVINMLEAVYGKDRVRVKVSADLNFDAHEKETTIYDPKNVVVSENSIKEITNNNEGPNSGSPVDDNMGNRAEDNVNNGTTTHEEITKNYEVSKENNKLIKAPGSVERVTVSVILDGVLDNATRNSVTNAVSSAVGLDKDRGDLVSVEGLPFDTGAKDGTNKDLDDMEKDAEKARKMKLYTNLGIIAGVLLLSLIIFIVIRRRRNKDEDVELEGIDVVLDDETPVEEVPKFKPIQLDIEDEKSHIEKQIRKYATDKPEQVAEIIKAWLAEDER